MIRPITEKFKLSKATDEIELRHCTKQFGKSLFLNANDVPQIPPQPEASLDKNMFQFCVPDKSLTFEMQDFSKIEFQPKSFSQQHFDVLSPSKVSRYCSHDDIDLHKLSISHSLTDDQFLNEIESVKMSEKNRPLHFNTSDTNGLNLKTFCNMKSCENTKNCESSRKLSSELRKESESIQCPKPTTEEKLSECMNKFRCNEDELSESKKYLASNNSLASNFKLSEHTNNLTHIKKEVDHLLLQYQHSNCDVLNSKTKSDEVSVLPESCQLSQPMYSDEKYYKLLKQTSYLAHHLIEQNKEMNSLTSIVSLLLKENNKSDSQYLPADFKENNKKSLSHSSGNSNSTLSDSQSDDYCLNKAVIIKNSTSKNLKKTFKNAALTHKRRNIKRRSISAMASSKIKGKCNDTQTIQNQTSDDESIEETSDSSINTSQKKFIKDVHTRPKMCNVSTTTTNALNIVNETRGLKKSTCTQTEEKFTFYYRNSKTQLHDVSTMTSDDSENKKCDIVLLSRKDTNCKTSSPQVSKRCNVSAITSSISEFEELIHEKVSNLVKNSLSSNIIRSDESYICSEFSQKNKKLTRKIEPKGINDSLKQASESYEQKCFVGGEKIIHRTGFDDQSGCKDETISKNIEIFENLAKPVRNISDKISNGSYNVKLNDRNGKLHSVNADSISLVSGEFLKKSEESDYYPPDVSANIKIYGLSSSNLTHDIKNYLISHGLTSHSDSKKNSEHRN